MKKMKTKNKCLVTSLAIIVMLMMSLGVKAQNVTIGPNNGSIITGQAGGNMDDSGIKRGMGSMWRHQQLPLTMTSSDMANLTAAGELADPACAIDKYTIDGEERLVLGAGQTNEYIVVSLPKGFRITGYRLVIQPNLHGNFKLHEGKATWEMGEDDEMKFYETPKWDSAIPYLIPNSPENLYHAYSLFDIEDRAFATATATDGSGTVMHNNNDTNRAKEYVIERTSNDMTNQLYFYFASNSNQYGVSVKSFEIRFTAQGTFDAEVTPVSSGEATSVVEVPFATSKMDIGDVEIKQNLYTYDYTGVRDVIAYNWLYQDDAVNTAGMPDKTKTVTTKNIHPVVVGGEAAYAFGADTYFVEPPTTVKTSGNSEEGKEAPIGYRVVGAKFDCNWADDVIGTTLNNQNAECQIRYGSGGNRRYLNAQLIFTEDDFRWKIDEYGNIYHEESDGIRRYLACRGSQDNRIVCLSSSPTGKESTCNLRLKRINNNNRICYTEGNNNYILYHIAIQEGSENHTRPYVELNHANDLAEYYITQTQDITVQPFYQGTTYTLDVYGTDKTKVVETRTLTSASDACSFTVSGLNNDAVMFKISGLPDKTVNGQTVKTQALVKVTLLLEALNPYIDKMDIVCHDAPNPSTGKPNLELTQTFTANDFSVSGGKFIFYVPSDYSEVPLTFTFSKLYSKYGDNTYYRGTPDQKNSTARYSFVTSDYFKKVSGATDNYCPIYDENNQLVRYDFPENGGLYDDTYYLDNGIGSNDQEAGEGNYYPYTDKVFTSTAGNVRFQFNNAESLTGSGTGIRNLTEYPFSVDKYIGYLDPDYKGTGTQETGSFIPCILKANVQTGDVLKNADIYYVFTADETRYNIAPTTALQHRAYAFYTMDILVQAKTFTPKFTWKKIYDNTYHLYKKPQTQKNDQGQDEIVRDAQGNIVYVDVEDREDSMWGLNLDVEGSEINPATGKRVAYLTYQEIFDQILGREATSSTSNDAIQSILGNNTNAPKYMRQILYVDGTALSSLLNSSQNSVVKTLKDLKDSLAINALVFLPENTTSTLDNVAYETASGGFLAGKDIVLTDKQPFFSPYKIQVDAANKATYSREVSGPTSTLVQHATVVLPFTLDVTNGKHTNLDDKHNPTPDGFEFNIRTMKKLVVSPSDNNYYSEADGYFDLYDNTKTQTKANQPYMVQVGQKKSDTYSFIALQYGATIEPTPTRTESVEDMGIGIKNFKSETEVNVNGLTSYGSYSGSKVPKTENIYYFNKDKFYCSSTLSSKYSDVYVRPFRAYYSPTDVSALAKITGFNILYDLFSDDGGITTSLTETSKPRVMTINTSKGSMLITATENIPVTIMSVNGLSVDSFNMNAGEQRQVNLPSGIYIVNNTKILVK